MVRIVLISSSKIERDLLADVVAPDDDLRIVVPAVRQSRLQWLANDDGEARSVARRVGDSVAESARAEVSVVDVKPDPPHQVLLDAIAEHRPDRVVVALRDGDEATWLEEGELEALPREIDGIPVVRISV